MGDDYGHDQTRGSNPPAPALKPDAAPTAPSYPQKIGDQYPPPPPGETKPKVVQDGVVTVAWICVSELWPRIFGTWRLASALVANACFQCMLSLRDPSTEDGKEEKSMEPADVVLEIEPEIVVIMAGDDHPTYVAKPSHPTLM
ncbi:hypothetical protein Tsubulata_046460 [Turnera subulata]|uniref:Uncharacterized protein n=1 Tax=Turnera subulata TaxID=218843 RepID=A0A9Q0FSB5_9ROSI|nr:hypothetical protein Tsubulata_046460 [Turnera subulata]